MTAEYGVGLSIIHNTAIDGEDFIDFLKSLRRHYYNKPIALFMDNLPVHKRLIVKPYYERLNIVPVWNIAYSPEFAPIGEYRAKLCLTFTVIRGDVLQGESPVLPQTTAEPRQQDRLQLRKRDRDCLQNDHETALRRLCAQEQTFVEEGRLAYLNLT